MSKSIYLYVPVNPEPWAIGPVGTARRNGKMTAYVGRNQQLAAYKEAVAESVREQWGDLPMLTGYLDLGFWFYRQRSEYTTAQAQTHRKHEADTTNLQKATEDALQGILFKNDKDSRRIRSVMMDQSADVVGAVIISINVAPLGLAAYEEERLPPEIRAARIEHIASVNAARPAVDPNAWPPQDAF